MNVHVMFVKGLVQTCSHKHGWDPKNLFLQHPFSRSRFVGRDCTDGRESRLAFLGTQGLGHDVCFHLRRCNFDDVDDLFLELLLDIMKTYVDMPTPLELLLSSSLSHSPSVVFVHCFSILRYTELLEDTGELADRFHRFRFRLTDTREMCHRISIKPRYPKCGTFAHCLVRRPSWPPHMPRVGPRGPGAGI